jgi:hypothetical protein
MIDSTGFFMNAFLLNDLHEEYTEARKIRLNFEQFLAFVTYYPALLVAKTDGVVDEKEWSLLQELSDRIVADTLPQDADKEEIKDYKQLFFDEFHYLIDNLDRWDRKFMKALKQLLEQRPALVEMVSSVLYLLADISKGVCEKESTMIEYLRNELQVSDLGKNIAVAQKSGLSQNTRNFAWQTFLASFW